MSKPTRWQLLIIISLVMISSLNGCSSGDDSNADGTAPFSAGALVSKLGGGYIDSLFINKAGDRIYFLYSPRSVSEFSGAQPPGSCPRGDSLSGHHLTPDPLSDFNTDLYYVELQTGRWSDPINLGSTINTDAPECCIWLNDEETEIIFYRETHDPPFDTFGLPPTGNYIATRADRNSPWGTPVALPGDYGTGNQNSSVYRHDLHKVPSGNLYLWEHSDAVPQDLLYFGLQNMSTYDAPVQIPGTVNSETQIWVNDAETRILYNRRPGVYINGDATTFLYSMTRLQATDAWGTPVEIPTSGFNDSAGKTVWGEVSFTAQQDFMMTVRLNETNICIDSEILYVPGDFINGFHNPVILNR